MLKRLGILLSLVLGVGAEELRKVEVVTDYPAHLAYRQTGQGRFTPLPVQPSLRNTVEVPFGEVWIQAEDRSGWWVIRSASQSISFSDVVTLSLQPSYRWERILPLTLMLTALAYGLGRRAQLRRFDQALIEQEPLIRSDGKIPRRRLGGYQLKSQLGSGAMGVVYLAENSRGERCAIKVPLPNLVAEQDFRERFQRELETGVRLQHGRIVRLLGLPVGPEPYLMMEYVEGTSLDRVDILSPREELPRCWSWCDQILEALEYIHERKVIHRDLKPANLMLLRDGSLKLMDFGIAHSADRTRLTASGTVLGTPVFMAPEQIQGAPCDPSIDIYALGVILYERLTGGLPFPTDCMQLLVYKLRGPMPSPKGLPSGWSDYLDALTAHNPKSRPNARRAREWLQRLPRSVGTSDGSTA